MPDSLTPPLAVQPVDADIGLRVLSPRRKLTDATLGMLSLISIRHAWRAGSL